MFLRASLDQSVSLFARLLLIAACMISVSSDLVPCNHLAYLTAQDGVTPKTTPKEEGISANSSDGEAENVAKKKSIQKWIDGLDAATSSERRRAEQALIAAGPGILNELPLSIPGQSPEAAERLARVREMLTASRIETDPGILGTRISLAGLETFGAALERLGLDTGVSFHHGLNDSDSIELASPELTFWHTLDLLLDQKNLDINFYGGGPQTLQLIRRQKGRPSRVDSADYRSIFRLEPTAVGSRRTLRQTGLGGINVAVEVSWEPQITPIGISFPLQKLRATLDDGSVLLPQQSGGTVDVSTTPQIAFAECNLPLQLPNGRPQKIVSLEGVMRSMLPGSSKRFEIPLVGGTREVTLDSMTVTLEQLQENNEIYQVVLGVELVDAGRSLESHRQWVFENRVFVERADGSTVEHLGFEVLRQSDTGFGVSYLFSIDEALNELRLIYESPTSVSSQEIEFELKEIPLP